MVRALLIGVSLMQAAGTLAQTLSASDCVEGAQFVRNAALSRDNGMGARQFIDRLDEDLSMVMAMPPPARWFVYSEVEERLLRHAVARVFDKPQDAEGHRTEFLAACDRLRELRACTEAACPPGDTR